MEEATLRSDPAAGTTTRRRTWRWLAQGLLVLAGIALFVRYALALDASSLRIAFSAIGFAWLPFALIVYTIAWALRVLRLQLLVRRAGGHKITWWDSTSTALGANALNVIAPARLGDVAAVLKMRPVLGTSTAAATIVLWRVIDLLGLLLLAVPTAVLARSAMPPLDLAAPTWVVIGVMLAVLLALGAVAWIARRRSAGSPLLLIPARRLTGGLAGSAAEFKQASKRLLAPKALFPSLVIASLAWVADAAVAWLVLAAALGTTAVPFWLAIVPTVVANIAKIVPATPGGIGVFETAFAASLAPFGVALEVAFAAGLVTHFVMNVFTLGAGAPSAWRTAQKASKMRAAEATPE